MAADAIVEGLARGDTSGAQLGKWGPAFNEGVDRMRRLVCEYYDGFSFGAFVRNYPHLTGTVTDLLIGDLFNEQVDKVWEPMESLYPPGKAPIPPWTQARPPNRRRTRPTSCSCRGAGRRLHRRVARWHSASPPVLGHVLLALAAVVVVGRLLGRLLARFGQPPVIGDVVAGIVLGPSLLGRSRSGCVGLYLFRQPRRRTSP